MNEGQTSIEQDISALEQRIAELKAQKTQESDPSDKELLRRAVSEKIIQHTQDVQPASSQPAIPANPAGITPDNQTRNQAQTYANLAFQDKGSIELAVTEAKKTHNPAIIKELETILVEHIHELIEKKKVPAL